MTTPALQPVFPHKEHALVNPNPDAWLEALQALGLRTLWQQASPCPCRENPDTEEGRFDCPVCLGTGWEYDTGTEIRAVMLAQSLKDAPYEVLGHYGFGLVMVTVPPEQAPGFRDRYLLLDSCIVMQDLVRRLGTLDQLRWPVATRTLYLDVSGVPTTTSLSVLSLRRQASDGSAGPLLSLGTDFMVDAQGRIDWTKGDLAGTAPPVGSSYAVRYFAHPRYVVLERPFVVRDTRTMRQSGGRKSSSRQHELLLVRALAKLDWERRTG